MFDKTLKLIKKYKAVLLYLIFGVLTTVINIVAYGLLKNILNIDYMVSNVIAWILAVTVAYITNRSYVFSSNNNSKHDIIKEMYIGVSLLHINDMFIKVVANVVVIVINYIMSKKIVFKSKN